jgi:hypothetical protein
MMGKGCDFIFAVRRVKATRPIDKCRQNIVVQYNSVQAMLLLLASTPVMLSWGEVRQNSSSMSTVVNVIPRHHQ